MLQLCVQTFAIYNNLGWKMWEDYTKYELIENVTEKWINFIICNNRKLELENKSLYCSLSYSCSVWLKEVCSFCQKAFCLYSHWVQCLQCAVVVTIFLTHNTGRARISQINPNLYSKQRIIVFKLVQNLLKGNYCVYRWMTTRLIL